MGRLTLRLPQSLHTELEMLAKGEGVSLNQYIVYALTRQTTLQYEVRHVSESDIQRQKEAFQYHISRLGPISDEEARRILAEREDIEYAAQAEKKSIE